MWKQCRTTPGQNPGSAGNRLGRMRAPRLPTLLVLGALAANPAIAQEHGLWLGLDVDLDHATGCSLAGGDASGDQLVSGLEGSARVVVDPRGGEPSVTSVRVSRCQESPRAGSPQWGPQVEESRPFSSVGVGGAGDFVQLLAETRSLGISGRVRLVTLGKTAGGHRDTLVTLDGSPDGPDILFPAVGALPPLEGPAVLALALAYCLIAILLTRWLPEGSSILLAAVIIGTVRLVWAFSLSLDGALEEWIGLPALATDPSEDAETGDPSAIDGAWRTAGAGTSAWMRAAVGPPLARQTPIRAATHETRSGLVLLGNLDLEIPNHARQTRAVHPEPGRGQALIPAGGF